MTARGIIVRIAAVAVFIGIGVAVTLAFVKSDDAQDTAKNIEVRVNAKTCGEGNVAACDRICQSLLPRLVVMNDSGQEFSLRCQHSDIAIEPDRSTLVEPGASGSTGAGSQGSGDSGGGGSGGSTGEQGPQGPQGEPGQPGTPSPVQPTEPTPGQGQGLGTNVCINNPLLPACVGVNINQGDQQ